MDIFTAVPGTILELGKTGTNETRAWRFPVKAWLEDYPDGVVSVLHQRPGDAQAYPVSLSEIDGEYVYWTITSTDVNARGFGVCELVMMDTDDHVAKSILYRTHTEDSLTNSGTTPPDPEESWVESVLAAATTAVTAKNDAETAQGKAEDAQEAAEIAQGKAEDAQDAAEDAQEAAETAQGKAEDAQEAAETAQEAAEDAQEAAEAAAETAVGTAERGTVQTGVFYVKAKTSTYGYWMKGEFPAGVNPYREGVVILYRIGQNTTDDDDLTLRLQYPDGTVAKYTSGSTELTDIPIYAWSESGNAFASVVKNFKAGRYLLLVFYSGKWYALNYEIGGDVE